LNQHESCVYQAFIYFKGSGGELRTQLYIAIKQGYIEQEKGKELVDLTKKLSAMISKFISARKNKIRKSSR
jgi:four helix bundle protein